MFMHREFCGPARRLASARLPDERNFCTPCRSPARPRVSHPQGPARGAYDRRKGDAMQYMLMIYEDERIYGPNKNGPALQEMVGRHMAFAESLGARRVGGAGLKATSAATTVRTTGGQKAIHDGPFAETKEQ